MNKTLRLSAPVTPVTPIFLGTEKVCDNTQIHMEGREGGRIRQSSKTELEVGSHLRQTREGAPESSVKENCRWRKSCGQAAPPQRGKQEQWSPGREGH